jgi:hypothetical protein
MRESSYSQEFRSKGRVGRKNKGETHDGGRVLWNEMVPENSPQDTNK